MVTKLRGVPKIGQMVNFQKITAFLRQLDDDLPDFFAHDFVRCSDGAHQNEKPQNRGGSRSKMP